MNLLVKKSLNLDNLVVNCDALQRHITVFVKFLRSGMYLSIVLTDFESCVDFDFLADLELDFEFFEEVLENCELSDD